MDPHGTAADLDSGDPPATAASPRGGPFADFSYPSVDPGFPALELDRLLGAHTELLARIKICYGTDRATYEREVLSLVRRYAAFVHLLPATPSNYFNEPGGLLQLGLETAFFALQGTDAHIFSGKAPIATRRHLEPRWRLATFIAGLCSEIERTLGQVIVTDGDGNEWPPFLQGLQPWLAASHVQRYYLKWRPNALASQGLGLFALPQIVPTQTLQHLTLGNTVIVPHMMACLAGMPLTREHNVLADLVRRSAALVIDRFMRIRADRYGKPQLGSHLERYLVDALRRLVASDAAWMPNAERSRVWYGSDGLYILWPNAAQDMRKLLEGDQLPGIPKSPETTLEILLAAGVLQPRDDGVPLWSIMPPGAKTAVEAVRLSDPAIALAGLDPLPTAIGAALACSTATAKSLPASPAPAPTPAKVPEPTSPAPVASPASAAAVMQHQLELPMRAAPEHGQSRPAELAAPALAPDGTEDTATVESQKAAPFLSPTPPSAALRLDLPLRLTARVRDALVDIGLALEASADKPLARLTQDGLFIAWSEFEQRGIEPNHARRALADARMLCAAKEPQERGASSEFDGRTCAGLTIAKAFIAGSE